MSGETTSFDGLPPLRAIIAEHQLSAKKSFGQNFLLDLNLTAKIAKAAGPYFGFVTYEVGPGPGGLTRAILKAGADPLIAVEPDPRAVAALSYLDQAYGPRFDLREADALHTDETLLGAGPEKPLKIVANLPYNIATPLLFRWLELVADKTVPIASLTLMFQKEVADRITARTGTKAFGRVSIMAQWLCETRSLFDLPPSAFTPPPKVTSTVVQLVPRRKPLAPARAATLEKVVAAAFQQRRKMLRQSLKGIHPDPVHLLQIAGIEETRRAETLSVEEFCTLARAFDRESA